MQRQLRVRETTGCGTQHYGLVDTVLTGQRLDSMTLEVLSNINGSVTLRKAGGSQQGCSDYQHRGTRGVTVVATKVMSAESL